MLLGNGFLPMFAGGAGKQTWDFAAGMPSGASILRSGGNATYFDATGVMQVASGSDTARRNHNPVTLSFEGLYVERASTNLLQRSAEFGTSPWTLQGASVTSNTAVAVDSTTTADTLASTSTATAYDSRVNQPVTVTVGTHTLSCFSKSATSGAKITLAIRADNGGVFSLTSTFVRYSVSAVTISTANNGRSNIYAAQAAYASGVITPPGYSIEVWGAQLELGSLTSYIPTTSTAVTRNAESLVLQSVAASALRVTFDDNSTQDISVTPGTITIAATALNRSLVRKVEEL